MSESVIHILSPLVANQIAAGEVVERPASVVKELVENALDAGAKHITVRAESAGKKRIEVEDDGIGMSAEDAEIAMQRHATSKISTAEDLQHIASHGFRGEALPSIASVSRFRMQTCRQMDAEGTEVRVDAGDIQLRPAPPRKGTRIEVLDLFLNTPARLNFMRTDKTEEASIVEVMRGLAISNSKIGMRLVLNDRDRFLFPAGQRERERVVAVMGDDFAENSVEQHIKYEGMLIAAHLGLPTYHHRDSSRMLFLVNGRVIRDKQLIAALRAGYRDVMFHDRYPIAVVRIEMDPASVDVNVHPAKREVRFKHPQKVRAGIVSCVRAAIEGMGQQVSTLPAEQALESMRRGSSSPAPGAGGSGGSFAPFSPFRLMGSNVPSADTQNQLFVTQIRESASSYKLSDTLDLGVPLAQIHRCYILAQSEDGVVLIDQHAAHERITYEKLKKQLDQGDVARQMMLAPVTWEAGLKTAAWLSDHLDELEGFGIELDQSGEESFLIRSVPALLSQESPAELVAELVDACMLIGSEAEGGDSSMGRVLERWLGNRACKGSIKAGRVLTPQEQEELLREMERTPNIAQCNHGRPTYVRLSLNDLDRLFGRKE